MCGIWGYVGSESVPVADGWEGLCSLTDRGPDDWGMYLDGEGKVTQESDLPNDDRSVVLGNRRLSILDLSEAGNQPMTNEDESLWIVYNGEVYNYREIRSDLRESGHTFDSETDTEVILRAYEEYGEDCVERFRGMFAFAIYDTDRKQVFAARDRFGIKPFYYHRDETHLAFASEVTSFLGAKFVDPKLDRTSVDGFLAFGYVPEPRTIVKGISSLPPGCRLVYDRSTGRCNIDRYWQVDFEGDRPATAERVRELLEKSVKLRLRSDVPVGVFLSGGLDSSALAALVAQNTPDTDEIHTFSIGFDHANYSEASFAEDVADQLGTEHSSTIVDATDIRSELPAIVNAMDQPTVDGVNTYFVSKLAAESGIKVAFSGLGSDELFGGYPSFDRIPRRYRAARVLYRTPSIVRQIVADAVEGIGEWFDGLPGDKAAEAIRSSDSFGAAYVSERGLFTSTQRRALVSDVPSRETWDRRVGNEMAQVLHDAGVDAAVSAAELSWYMNNQLLRDTDIMSMSNSLEVRVPFLDTGLAEALAKDGGKSIRRGEKELLKRSVSDILPEDVLEREKSGFVFPFSHWLSDELAGIVDGALEPDRLQNASLDPTAARQVRERFREGEIHWKRLWGVVVLSLWVDRHIPE